MTGLEEQSSLVRTCETRREFDIDVWSHPLPVRACWLHQMTEEKGDGLGKETAT